MAASTTIQILKKVAPDLIDKNGNFRTIPIGDTGRRNLSDSRIALIQSIYKLLRIEGFMSEETRMYIFDPYITMSGINKRINDALMDNPMWDGKRVNQNTTYSKIGYDRLKLDKALGKDIMTDIIYKSQNNDDISEYSRKVAILYAKINKTNENEKLRANLALDLGRDTVCSELSDEKFDEFLSVIKPYIKEQMQNIVSGLDTDTIGYFNYLLYCPTLSEQDSIRLEILRVLLDPDYKSDIEVE